MHFYLPADHGSPIPLNWVLSDATARFIWGAFTDEQVPNAVELARLDEALAPDPLGARRENGLDGPVGP